MNRRLDEEASAAAWLASREISFFVSQTCTAICICVPYRQIFYENSKLFHRPVVDCHLMVVIGMGYGLVDDCLP